MDIGELNRRVEILKYFVKRDAYGGEDGRWLPVGRVWAKIEPVSGTEYFLWGAGFLLCLVLSMFLLAKAVQTLPIGTAYPVWTGIGAVGTVLLGIFFFNEPVTFWRIFFISTLIISVIGLKMVSSH